MKLPKIEILDEKDKLLHKVSEDLTFPLSKELKKTLNDMIVYLEMSQDEKIAEKYCLRAGMGLALVQLGILKRGFVLAIEHEDAPGTFDEYIFLNPKIISQSEEKIFVGEGEGCLSVNRAVDGIVPRCARVTIEYNDLDGNKKTIRVREDVAVACQHEIDHLNGILFTDRIDKKNPFKDHEKMREI